MEAGAVRSVVCALLCCAVRFGALRRDVKSGSCTRTIKSSARERWRALEWSEESRKAVVSSRLGNRLLYLSLARSRWPSHISRVCAARRPLNHSDAARRGAARDASLFSLPRDLLARDVHLSAQARALAHSLFTWDTAPALHFSETAHTHTHTTPMHSTPDLTTNAHNRQDMSKSIKFIYPHSR